MANSKITITFNSRPAEGNLIGFHATYYEDGSDVGFVRYLFFFNNIPVNIPIQPSDVVVMVILPNPSAPLDEVAGRFMEAIASHPSMVNFTKRRIGNVVEITYLSDDIRKVKFESPANYPDSHEPTGSYIYSNSPATNIVINNSTFAFESVVFSTGSDPCTSVKMIVMTTELTTKVISPISISNNTFNPFFYDLLRNQTYFLQVENSNGDKISKTVITPSFLTSSNFSLQLNNGPNSATLIVSNENTYGLVLEYSLNGNTWQSANTFNALAVGSYTLYVRDNYGCSFTKKFDVNEFGVQLPFFYISKANSIRYANRIAWGDSENYKTDENTLSCEVDVQMAYKEFQQFQSADIITTQFKSNYSSNIASVIKEDGSIVNIPIVKKTNNIGLKDRRDAIKYDIGGGKSGVYFISGNVYDYNTNVISSTYSLNGLLPEWAQIGNYFEISGFWYLIENIIFDEIKNADIIVFANTYTGTPVTVVVGSIFNRCEYEVYEYSIDMVDYINQKIRVKLVNSNAKFPTITHLSEVIWCKVKHDNLLEIKYRNKTNNDVYYSTGIEHLIRIPYLKISGKLDENSEVHKTDTNTILLNADIYEMDEFQFEPVSKGIWHKITQALSHEIVSINGVGYVKNGNFNTEGALDKSNLYLLTATMIKTGSVYNSQTSGNLYVDGTSVEVPGLISTEKGYLSY